MSPQDFNVGLKDSLAGVMKRENIIDQPELLEKYSRDHSFVSGSSPRLAVFPGSREEVQGIVRLSGEMGIPLVPISSGPPHFHGDTIPETGGIMVDFSRLKRIIKIDAVNRYAWLEPGVTFGELMPELKKHGLKLDAPLLPRPSKSVVTSRLEREPVIIPKYQYDYIDPLLTLEVVYGTGDDFRTGSASGPGPTETLKADRVNPWGPGSVDYFRFISGAQGTMGLVTWAVTKVEVSPAMQKLYFVPLEDVRIAADIMNQLLRRRVADECLALNNVNLAAMLAESWPDDYTELKKKLPPWTLMVIIAGYQRRPEERLAIQEKYLKEVCASPGTKAVINLPGAEGRENDVLKLLSGPWPGEPYWKLRYKGSCQDIFFLTTLSRAAGLTGVMRKVAAKYRYPADDIGAYLQPLVQGRGCHGEFNLFCDASDTGEVNEVKRLFMDASQTLMQNGAFFSRPYGPWANMVYSRGGGQVAALKKLKGIFDPNNILNPGKLCF
jgi:FAD/FMN-containing dehydrogenase